MSDRPRLVERCRGLAHDKREYALVLDVGDVAELLRPRAVRNWAGIDAHLDRRFAQLNM